MTKIVHILYSPESSGRAGLRIHRAFTEAKMDSSIISLLSSSLTNEKIKYLGKLSKLYWKIEYKIQQFLSRKTNKQFGMFTAPILGSNLTKLKEVQKADVIYLHWVLWGLLNLKNIEKLAKLGKPIIFFMHDMWTITGGCHHSFTCDKYKTHCGECQVFKNSKLKDASWSEFNKKQKLYSKYNNLHFVSPSTWLNSCAKQSQLTKNKPLYYIPNIIDTSQFISVDKKVAKQILNINPDHKVIAFGAIGVDSPYKGWSYLKNAMELLKDDANMKNTTVLVFGNGNKDDISKDIPFNVKYMGYLRDEISMSMIYNAADVFIAPSLAEVFGYVIYEALCCGTPVVAFNVGGIPDLIEHKVNGYLANYKDSEDLCKGIKYCIENNVQGSPLPGFDTDDILAKHKNLINSIIKAKN